MTIRKWKYQISKDASIKQQSNEKLNERSNEGNINLQQNIGIYQICQSLHSLALKL